MRAHLLHLNSVPPGKLLFQAHVSEAQPQGVLLSRGASQAADALRNGAKCLKVILQHLCYEQDLHSTAP